MARDKDFDLRAALSKPSFTPGQRDIGALVELIATDEEAAVRASPALAKLGEPARAAVIAGIANDANDPRTTTSDGRTTTSANDARTTKDQRGAPTANDHRSAPPIDDGGAARLVSALGLMARAGDRAARAELIARLGDPRVRVRRAAIVALGKLGATRAMRVDQREVDLREAARREAERRTDEQPPLVDLRENERRGDDRRASEPDDDVRVALIARWDATDVPPDERRALAEALGKIGGAGVRERLASLDAASDKELERRRDRALLVAEREDKRGEDSTVLVDRAPPRPLIVRLGCRPALAELLIAEARAAGFDGKAVRDDAVEVPLTGPWNALFASRLWATAAIRVEDRGLRAHARNDRTNTPATHDPRGDRSHRDRTRDTTGQRTTDRQAKADRGTLGDRAKVSDAIVRAVLSDEVRGLMTAWTRGPIRWRLSLARGHQRAVVWNVAKEVTKSAPMLINDPTQTTWDIQVDDEEGVLELVPRRAEDPRFAYRVAEVPAASHPSVAAAVVWLGAIEPGDRVWDPFCGSGLELAEAALRGAGTLVGSDLDDDALAAARKNLDAVVAALDARSASKSAARSEVAQLASASHAPSASDAVATDAVARAASDARPDAARSAADASAADARSASAAEAPSTSRSGAASTSRTAADASAPARPTILLARGDARDFTPPGGLVDAIVTNPPLGSRVHVDAGALLAEALPHFARQLRPGGRLVWITPQWRRTTPVAEAAGFVLVRSLFVDLGGVRGRLERWDRRR